MRLLGILIGLALLGLASAHAVVAAAAEPLATRRQAFLVPFRISQPRQAGNQPLRVELHVSLDQGKSWRLHTETAPTERGFKFQAPHDGEYCFAIRTKDSTGRTWPQTPLAPELTVIVDTAPPKLELQARRGPDGEIIAEILIREDHVSGKTLKLDYVPLGATSPWLPLAVEPLPPGATGPEHRGEIVWTPPQTAAAFAIRAEVADIAGNRAVTQIELGAASESVSPITDSVTTADPAPGNPVNDPPVAATAWPADVATAPLASDPARLPGQSDSPGGLSDSARITRLPPVDQESTPLSNPGTGPLRTVEARVDSAYQSELTPIDSDRRGRPRDLTSGRTDWRRQVPQGVTPRMVSSTRFGLDYDLETVGPGGIRKVELWGTPDGGRTWSNYGADDDNRSPLLAILPGEGLYGFRILAHSGNGLRETPPQSGDQPELWVGVDLTKPTCQITGVQDGADERAGQLIIQWTAEDAQLAERPVSLYFAATTDGPWHIISANLKNNGQYAWQVDSRAPDRIHLRLEVRDEAGNIAAAHTQEAVNLDRLRPRGRIRDVHSVDESATRPRVYRFE